MKEIKSGVPSQITTLILASPSISYIPQLNQFTGSVKSTILLCHAMALATKSNPFYKFIQSCNHPNYKPGDSWCEELAFSRTEFLGAISLISDKVSSKTIVFNPEVYIWYWTDISRQTFYLVNWNAVNRALAQVYSA